MEIRSAKRLRVKYLQKTQAYLAGMVSIFVNFLTQYISTYCFRKSLNLGISFKIRYNG